MSLTQFMSVLQSLYEPGKRHWLKIKKDYLYGGAMADSADLVVLGAWFGTGQKGRIFRAVIIHVVTFVHLHMLEWLVRSWGSVVVKALRC
jgi:hypothetical protein